MRAVDERIAAGVEWLDANYPNWIDVVEVNQLNLWSACNCVLGQLFATEAGGENTGYDYAIEEVWDEEYQNVIREPILTSQQAQAYGFDIDFDLGESIVTYQELTDKWKEVIASRKN